MIISKTSKHGGSKKAGVNGKVPLIFLNFIENQSTKVTHIKFNYHFTLSIKVEDAYSIEQQIAF